MIKALKTYLRNKAEQEICEVHKCERKYRSIEQVKSMIIIFDGTQISRYGRVNDIIKSFQNDNKNVTCLAYFDAKELDAICLTQNNIQFISKADFNWFGVPNPEFIDEFLNKQYDLCINLNLVGLQEVETLCNICDAELKVGKNFGTTTVSDFMINVTDDKDETFLVKQIIYYLRSVKSNER